MTVGLADAGSHECGCRAYPSIYRVPHPRWATTDVSTQARPSYMETVIFPKCRLHPRSHQNFQRSNDPTNLPWLARLTAPGRCFSSAMYRGGDGCHAARLADQGHKATRASVPCPSRTPATWPGPATRPVRARSEPADAPGMWGDPDTASTLGLRGTLYIEANLSRVAIPPLRIPIVDLRGSHPEPSASPKGGLLARPLPADLHPGHRHLPFRSAATCRNNMPPRMYGAMTPPIHRPYW